MQQDNPIKLALYKLALIIPDKWFLSIKFFKHFHRFPNWDVPQTFNEKLQWLKINCHNPLYPTIVDKSTAKQYVANIIGPQYIVPTLGIWDKAEDIDFDILPNKFVLKATHDSGRVIVCTNKQELDKDWAIREMRKSLQRDFYSLTREWPYKQVPRKIIAEEYLEGDGINGDLADYKFFCYNGHADMVMLCLERYTGDTKYYFFNRNWELERVNIRGKKAPMGFTIPKPNGIEKMFELADQLSKNIPFVRVDFYNIKGHVFFGEMTFYPQSGFDENLLPETDILFGQKIKL